jgi:hypothetical protein
MKKLILILSFMAMSHSSVFAQRGNEDWTTPIADVKFEDGKIVYTVSMNDLEYFPHLLPVSFDKDLLVIRHKMIPGSLDAGDFKKLFQQTDDYLEMWQPALANNRDKYIFLEHCVIKILCDRQNRLSAHILEVLHWLETDLSVDIAESAGLVKKLYNYYAESK